MAASNKRRATSSPSPKQRRFGDKIALHHCNEEKKVAKKRTSKVLEEKTKFTGRKRRISSPSQKENHYAVAIVSRSTLNTLSSVDEYGGSENPLTLVHKGLQLPEVRMVGRLTALRCQPRLSDERVGVEVFAKRHEKLEKEEKQILRRDRIWQNELRHRSHLLRVQQSSPPFRDFRIVVIRKSRSFK